MSFDVATYFQQAIIDGYNAGELSAVQCAIYAASYLSRAIFTNANVEAIAEATAAPMIAVQPQSQLVSTGGTVAFAVIATGKNVQYQWYLGTDAIKGANDSTYTIPSVQSTDAGTYMVSVTNLTGSVESNAAVLTVQ